MTLRMPHRCIFHVGLAILGLLAGNFAVAQRTSTTKQDLKQQGPTINPTSGAPGAENPRGTRDSWVPPDIDAAPPLVEEAVSCSLPDVVSRAGSHVEELVHNLDRFSATEIIQHENVGRSGNLLPPEIQKFNYVFSMRERSDGYMDGEEYRSRDASSKQTDDPIETLQATSIVLIFHPNYVKNFRMSCEGLGEWRGQPAWQVRFEERPDCERHLSVISMDGKIYNVMLRGRAWILADSYQIAHIEMDLAETIPKIHLRIYHQAFEFRPVSIPADAKMWLPTSAELYLDFKGHRFYRRHTYVDFKLFSVKVQQQIGELQ